MTDEYESWKESKLQSTGQAHPDDWKEYKDSSMDWGQSFDDMDGVDWADHMGGPDDDEIEKHYENIAQQYEDEEYEEQIDFRDEYFEEEETDEETRNEHVSRIEEIIEWLAGSKLARRFRSREDFFVLKGPHVRLKDGSVIDLLDWLFEEGLKGGYDISGYRIIYSKYGSEYGEKLSFFKIFDAPFEPLSKANKVARFEYDDIPL